LSTTTRAGINHARARCFFAARAMPVSLRRVARRVNHLSRAI